MITCCPSSCPPALTVRTLAQSVFGLFTVCSQSIAHIQTSLARTLCNSLQHEWSHNASPELSTNSANCLLITVLTFKRSANRPRVSCYHCFTLECWASERHTQNRPGGFWGSDIHLCLWGLFPGRLLPSDGMRGSPPEEEPWDASLPPRGAAAVRLSPQGSICFVSSAAARSEDG